MAIVQVAAGLAAAAAAVLGAIYAAMPESAQRVAKEEMARLAMGEVDEYENEAMKAAFATMGLDIEPSEGLTPQAITQAINAGPLAGTGIELTNLFDRDAVKRDLEKIAIAQAASAFGVEIKSLRPEGIKEAVKGEGLSPRVRGNPVQGPMARDAAGPIPARAGQPRR